jgi:hypothetical protein
MKVMAFLRFTQIHARRGIWGWSCLAPKLAEVAFQLGAVFASLKLGVEAPHYKKIIAPAPEPVKEMPRLEVDFCRKRGYLVIIVVVRQFSLSGRSREDARR